jgi:hypothetical protein
MRILIIVIGMLICPFVSVAQTVKTRTVTHQQLLWLRYTNRLELNPHWFLYTDLSERRLLFPDAQHQMLGRITAQYRWRENWAAGVGFAYSRQSPNDPRAANKLVVPELRPHIEAVNRQPLGERVMLSQRYRLEYRFFKNVEDEELASGFNSYLRFRYKLEVNFWLRKKPNELGAVVWKLADEVMLNAGKEIVLNVFDQNRLSTSLQVQAFRNIAFELNYIRAFQQRNSGYDFFNRDIFRLAIHHQWKLKKETGHKGLKEQ